MAEYRIARPDEREAYVEFANYVFSTAHNPHDFEALLPKVYGENVESSCMQRVAVDERGRIRALVAMMPGRATVCGTELRTGIIGTVSVHPKARGEGHMKRLMNDWLNEMKDTCDIASLGGQRQRYEYFGFTRGGTCIEYDINSTNIRHALGKIDASDITFTPLFDTPYAQEYALALHAARPAFAHRDARPLCEILATFRQKPLAILKNDHRIGYMLTDHTGGDITELALEDTSTIAAVVKAYMAYAKIDKLTVTAPEYDAALNACLGGFAEDDTESPSGMYNIFNFEKVLLAYLSLKHQTMGLAPGVFSAVLDGQPVTARVDENDVSVEPSALPGAPALDKLQAQRLLLTRHGRFMGLDAPAGWFPLPVFRHRADEF